MNNHSIENSYKNRIGISKKVQLTLLSKIVLMIPITLLSILIVSSFTSALGVTPARTMVSFSPGLEQTVKFTVVNSEYKNIGIKIYVQGELNQSIALSETEFNMASTEESKEMFYTFTLPQSLSPGPHTADIVILQKPGGVEASEAFVGATVAVVTQLVVNVPYPGKYAVADLNVLNAQQNAETTFVIPVVALGAEDINSAQASIEIFDKNNIKVGELNTQPISIQSGKRGEIVSRWIANVPLGRYVAKAVLVYDGHTLDLQKEFAVGNETLELQQVTVPNFNLGGIAKFEMLIENKWSEPIVGAYSQTQVFKDDGNVIADFKSPTYDIPALTKSIFVSYWDTAGLDAGIYNTSVFMRYGIKYSQQNIQLRVSENEIIALGLGFVISQSGGKGNLVTVLIIIVILLVLMNIAWFFVFRKRIGNKNSKTSK